MIVAVVKYLAVRENNANMSPEQFIEKWRGTTRTERSAAQEHFLDLCALLGVPKPGDVDRHGTEYTFEKATRKIGDTTGFADVWKRRCFAWEYKGNRRNLVEAYAQLKQYADALDNPPLLIVSDMQEIRVHTNFTNAIAQQHPRNDSPSRRHASPRVRPWAGPRTGSAKQSRWPALRYQALHSCQ